MSPRSFCISIEFFWECQSPGGGRGLQTRCGVRQTGPGWVRFPSTPARFRSRR